MQDEFSQLEGQTTLSLWIRNTWVTFAIINMICKKYFGMSFSLSQGQIEL